MVLCKGKWDTCLKSSLNLFLALTKFCECLNTTITNFKNTTSSLCVIKLDAEKRDTLSGKMLLIYQGIYNLVFM